MYICTCYCIYAYCDSVPPSHGWYFHKSQLSVDMGECIIWFGFGLQYHTSHCKIVTTVVGMTVHDCHIHTSLYSKLHDHKLLEMLWQVTVGILDMFLESFDVQVLPFITAHDEMFVLSLLSSCIGIVTM